MGLKSFLNFKLRILLDGCFYIDAQNCKTVSDCQFSPAPQKIFGSARSFLFSKQQHSPQAVEGDATLSAKMAWASLTVFCLFLDINECAVASHKCDKNAQCVDTDGNYTCLCSPGYTGNGFECASRLYTFLTNFFLLF